MKIVFGSPPQSLQETSIMDVHSKFFKEHCASYAWEHMCTGKKSVSKVSKTNLFTHAYCLTGLLELIAGAKRSCISCLLGNTFFTLIKMFNLLPALYVTSKGSPTTKLKDKSAVYRLDSRLQRELAEDAKSPILGSIW